MINFPSEEVRSKISTCKSFDFDTCHIKASVVETGMTEDAIDELAVVWVKIFGVPKLARSEEHIKAIVELVGEFEMIDLSTLRRDGPVRERLACKDPRELHFAIHVYINKVGYMIRWEPEGYPPYDNSQFPPDDGDDKDKKGNGDNDDMNVDEDQNTQSPARGRSAHDRRSFMGGSRGDVQSAPPAYKGKKALEETCLSETQQCPTKRAACKKQSLLVVEKESMVDQEGDSKAMIVWEGNTTQDVEYESQEIDFPVTQKSTEEGDNEDVLTGILEFEKCDIPSLFDIAIQREEEELDEEDSFQEVSYKKNRPKKSEPAITSRMSLRNRDMASVPIPKIAELLTQKKNLETGGNSNPFVVFQIIDPVELNSIAIAANISLGSNEEEIANTIETIKAKELVQAKLAEMRWKKEKEKEMTDVDSLLRNEKELPDNMGEEVDNLNTPSQEMNNMEISSESLELKKRGGAKKHKKK